MGAAFALAPQPPPLAVSGGVKSSNTTTRSKTPI